MPKGGKDGLIMTTIFIIGLIALVISMPLSLFDIVEMFEHNRKFKLVPFLVVLGCMCLLIALNQSRLEAYYEVKDFTNLSFVNIK